MAPSKKASSDARRQAQRKATAKNYGELLEFVNYGLENHEPIRFIGGPGIGKTQAIKAAIRERGLNIVYFSLATLSAEDLAVVAPTSSKREMLQPDGSYKVETVLELETLLFDVLSNEDPKVIVLDEYSRGDKRTMASVMSLINEGEINDKKIPNLVGIFALDNPDDGSFMVSSGDHAQNTRFGAHVLVTANDIMWREALLSKYEEHFGPEVMERVFSTWEGFPVAVREVVSPRVIDWMLSNAVYGVPIEWALGVEGLETFKILDETGTDVTKHTIRSMAAAIGVPATYGFKYPAVEALQSAIDRADAGIKANVRLVGHAGFAKTAYVKATLIEKYGPEGVISFSLATTSPENLGVPVPIVKEDSEESDEDGDRRIVRELMFMLHKRFNDDHPKVLVLDEFSRAGKRTLNAVMEVVQEGTLNGHPIRGLQFVVALDNPHGKRENLGGVPYTTERLDRAQSTRFAMTVALKPQDIPWQEYLREKYGEMAEPFLAWWGSGLDEVGKIQANARLLEKMIRLFRAGRDIENALPIVTNNLRMGPDLTNLKAILDDIRVVTLTTIVNEVDAFCEVLAAGEDHPDYTEYEAAAVNAFELITDVNTLEKHKDVIMRVSVLLGKQWRIASVSAALGNTPVLRWWVDRWQEHRDSVAGSETAA